MFFKKEEEPDSLPRAMVERGNYAELLLIRVALPVNVTSGTLGTGHKTRRLTPGWGKRQRKLAIKFFGIIILLKYAESAVSLRCLRVNLSGVN